MGIDTRVILRVRSRAAFREALAAAGDPPFRLLDDSTVSMFTGLPYNDEDGDYEIRCWLFGFFGDRLSQIHDDPRGVIITPDTAEPRARSYDAIAADIGEVGRFVVPTPPSAEESEARERRLEASSKAMDAVTAAHESGDEAAFAAALEAAPADVRAYWDQAATFQQMLAGGGTNLNDMFAKMMGSVDLGGGGDLLGAVGGGLDRVCVLVPPNVTAALATRADELELNDYRHLEDGSIVLVSNWISEQANVSRDIANVLDSAGFERATLDAVPFFDRSLLSKASGEASFAAARASLGTDATMRRLQTFDELIEDERRRAKAWLHEPEPA